MFGPKLLPSFGEMVLWLATSIRNALRDIILQSSSRNEFILSNCISPRGYTHTYTHRGDASSSDNLARRPHERSFEFIRLLDETAHKLARWIGIVSHFSRLVLVLFLSLLWSHLPRVQSSRHYRVAFLTIYSIFHPDDDVRRSTFSCDSCDIFRKYQITRMRFKIIDRWLFELAPL